MTGEEIIALQGDRYSPNLRGWLIKNLHRHFVRTPSVYQSGGLWVGDIEEDGWFVGAQLRRVLVDGRKVDVGTWVPEEGDPPELLSTFWARYAAIGRCAIDPEHRTTFIGNETRWAVEGDTRHCLWCGNHTQHLFRWTETVAHKAWRPGEPPEPSNA